MYPKFREMFTTILEHVQCTCILYVVEFYISRFNRVFPHVFQCMRRVQTQPRHQTSEWCLVSDGFQRFSSNLNSHGLLLMGEI